eukprot:TRINITY_DN13529_c0_g1_i1.p1 TRINITY_DN13529_c0_g1~~TRINITY_DN13529_c0_g1_i1.p1  ORF type:complete len:150 (-),score=0.02 TRINITY_DN13529_c0_g1_i1:25-474(-)
MHNLANLTKLQEFSIQDSSMGKNIIGLEGLTRITSLTFQSMIDDVSWGSLSKLTNLRVLVEQNGFVSTNPDRLAQLMVFKHLTKLTTGTKETCNFEHLTLLTTLQELDLFCTPLLDLQARLSLHLPYLISYRNSQSYFGGFSFTNFTFK